jgi:cytoskeleton protein RodZ
VNEIDSQQEPGESLRQAREAAGLTTKDVANSLNLVLSNIESIEANQYENMNAGIFTRGYVKNYARFLGLDADALVAAADVRLKGASHNSGKDDSARSQSRREFPQLAALKPAHKVVIALFGAAVIWACVSLVLGARNHGDTAVPETGEVARESATTDPEVNTVENAAKAEGAEATPANDADIEE